MIRIGYAPGAFDLFSHRASQSASESQERCDYLIAGVVSDEVLIAHKGVTPVVPLAERIEIVRNCRHVDAAHAATTDDSSRSGGPAVQRLLEGRRLARDRKGYAPGAGSSQKSASKSPIFPTRRRRLAVGLRRTLQNIDELAKTMRPDAIREACALNREIGWLVSIRVLKYLISAPSAILAVHSNLKARPE